MLDGLTGTGWTSAAEVLGAMRSPYVPAELDEIAAKARGLREWFRRFVQKKKGRPLLVKDSKELEPLNRLLERDAQHGEIVANAGSGFAFRQAALAITGVVAEALQSSCARKTSST